MKWKRKKKDTEKGWVCIIRRVKQKLNYSLEKLTCALEGEEEQGKNYGLVSGAVEKNEKRKWMMMVFAKACDVVVGVEW